jgi:ribosomal protein S21
VLDKRRQAGTRMVLDSPDDLEFALRLFRDDSLMAKSEARRKSYFVPPSARRRIKSIAARKRAARTRRKRPVAAAG